MIAIRISESNKPKIRASVTDTILPDSDLDAMVEEYSQHTNGPIYFVPVFELKSGQHVSWATIPHTHALENYEFDESLIDNQFVRFTNK